MYVGIDIGGTYIKYGVITKDGEVLSQNKIPTNYSLEEFYVDLETIIKQAQTQYKIEGIGISAPGIVKSDGTMLTAGAIKPFYGANFKVELEKRTGLPVKVENDANAATIAEKWIGNATDYRNYLCIVLGTGVGGGIVINNDLYIGAHGMAGEFGWMIVAEISSTDEINEETINKRGAVVSGLVDHYNKSLKDSGHKDQQTQDAQIIMARAENGEKTAILAMDRFYENIAICLVNLMSLYDPEAILIGGGISENPKFNQQLQEKLIEIESRHESIGYLMDKTVPPVITAKLKNNAGMIGAVYQVHKQLHQ